MVKIGCVDRIREIIRFNRSRLAHNIELNDLLDELERQSNTLHHIRISLHDERTNYVIDMLLEGGK